MAILETAGPLRAFASQRSPSPNPKHRIYHGRASRALSRPSYYSPFPRFEATLAPRLVHLDPAGSRLQKRCLGNHIVTVYRRISSWTVSLESPHEHEESMHSNIEVEENMDELKKEGNQPLEEARKMTKYFNEAIEKLQDTSQKVYGSYIKIAMLLANESGIEVPFPLQKDLGKIGYWINDLKETSGLRDFQVGIPYGIFLVIWGFISFMRTRSVSFLWFGCHLGYILINESISSCRSWTCGLSYKRAFCRQYAIAAIVVLRMSFEHSFQGILLYLMSAAVIVFYVWFDVKDPGAGILVEVVRKMRRNKRPSEIASIFFTKLWSS